MNQLPKFKNAALLQQALTHCSLPNHNEQLEFLGDGILQGAVTGLLYQRFPNCSEGVLTEKRKALVRNAALAKLARRLQLGPKLRLDANSERQGCRTNPRILSGAVEAIIGAYFLDAGSDFKAVERYIKQVLGL